MNDKELADAVVALGVGEQDKGFPDRWYIPHESGALFTDEFVRDWRVAGACFEALDRAVYDMVSLIQSAELIEVRGKNWPRAIIEACVKAKS